MWSWYLVQKDLKRDYDTCTWYAYIKFGEKPYAFVVQRLQKKQEYKYSDALTKNSYEKFGLNSLQKTKETEENLYKNLEKKKEYTHLEENLYKYLVEEKDYK